MSQWHVELICKRPVLLTFLSKALQEPLCTIKARNTDCYQINPGAEPILAGRKTSGYFLLSSEFDSLTEDIEVYDRAMAMLPFLNALVKLKIDAYTTPIEFDDVFRPDAQGRLIWETARVTATFSGLESKLQKAKSQSFDFAAIWLLAQKHQEVYNVVNYLANETNWFNLYKAYETIEKETHKLENNKTIKKGTFDGWAGNRKSDFKESANKERHSSLGYHPKPGVAIVYLSLDEAAQFVTNIFFQWLQTKTK